MKSVSALRRIGPAAISVLGSALSNADPVVREDAALALGAIGPAAESAVPELAAVLSDAEREVRERAVSALGQIGPAAIPALRSALSNADPVVRENAVLALGTIGPAAESAVPELAAVLSDAEREVRENAAWALVRIGGAAVSTLVSIINDLNFKINKLLNNYNINKLQQGYGSRMPTPRQPQKDNPSPSNRDVNRSITRDEILAAEKETAELQKPVVERFQELLDDLKGRKADSPEDNTWVASVVSDLARRRGVMITHAGQEASVRWKRNRFIARAVTIGQKELLRGETFLQLKAEPNGISRE